MKFQDSCMEFKMDDKIFELLNDISSNPTYELSQGVKIYRSRIFKGEISKDPNTKFKGYNAEESFLPPKDKMRENRANDKNTPCLYCANEPYTALVEVRPRLAANVSIATILVKEKLRFLDCTLRNLPDSISAEKQKMFQALSCLFSKPVVDEDNTEDYIPTQCVAKYAQDLGYDGILYKSSLTPEESDWKSFISNPKDRFNIAVFQYQKCEAVASNVVQVTRMLAECAEIDNAASPLEISSVLAEALHSI